MATDDLDQKAVLLARSGDADAFAQLLAPRCEQLLWMLAAAIGDWHEAEDALQEVLLRAFRQVSRLREPAAFDAWLRTIALHTARNRLQSEVARVRREGLPGGDLADLQQLLDCAAQPDLAEPPVEAAESPPILAAVAALPPLQRRAGHLAWVAGLPAQQIAELLGISKGHLHVVLHRARRRLASRTERPLDPVRPSADAILVGGYTADRWVEHLRVQVPELRLRIATTADADVVAVAMQDPPPLSDAPAPPSPTEALPLDGLAAASGFDLEPFGDRILRHTWGDRPYYLPHHSRLRLVVYNADLLCRAGLPVPPAPDWTWDHFFGYCRRCAAAGISPLSRAPAGIRLERLAEHLGVMADGSEPGRGARLRAPGRPALDGSDEDGWYVGRAAFDFMPSAQPARGFEIRSLRPFRWGIAPLPRVRRSDHPISHWTRVAIAVRGTVRDPLGAFAAVRAVFTDGPHPTGGELPAYRTPEVLRAWRAQPLPVGKECLLDVEWSGAPGRQPEPTVCR